MGIVQFHCGTISNFASSISINKTYTNKYIELVPSKPTTRREKKGYTNMRTHKQQGVLNTTKKKKKKIQNNIVITIELMRKRESEQSTSRNFVRLFV